MLLASAILNFGRRFHTSSCLLFTAWRLSMSEKGLWAATSRTDVLFSIVQVALKGALAVLGWYSALTLPPLFTEAGALTLPP